MRRLPIALVAALAASVSFGLARPANAGLMSGDIIRLGDLPGGPGGIFAVTKPADSNVSFLTFCAHVYEDLDFDRNYMAVISDYTDPDHLPVGSIAAWLYTQFLRQSDQLTGFNYNLITSASNFSTTANNQARALQLGIWLGMGFSQTEIAFNSGWSTSYINQLKSSYLDAWLANYDLSGWADTNHTGKIRILNLYGRDSAGNYTRNIQDQLFEVPEPGAASVVCVLLAALLTERSATRRRKAKRRRCRLSSVGAAASCRERSDFGGVSTRLFGVRSAVRNGGCASAR